MGAIVRRALFALAIAFGVALLGILAAAGLLLGTTAGARGGVSWLQRALPAGSLSVREVRGTLLGPLELRGFEYRTPSLLVSAQRVRVRWNLAGLPAKKLTVGSLEADSVRVRSLPAPAPDSTQAPGRLPALRLPVELRVRDLQVRGFAYVPAGDGAPFVVDSVRAAASYRGDSLALSSFSLRSPLVDAGLRGHVRTAGDYPLEAEVVFSVRPPGRPELGGRGHVAGSLERARVTARLERPFEASADAWLSRVLVEPFVDGTVEFARLDPHVFAAAVPAMQLGGRIGTRGTVSRFEAGGQVSMRSPTLGGADASGSVTLAGDSLHVTALRITVPRRPERLSVRGLVTRLSAGPHADLSLDWERFTWPLAGADTLFRSDRGSATVKGTAASYEVRLTGQFATSFQDLGEWRMEATGDTNRVEVTRLTGRLAGGSASGTGTFAWRPRPTWSGTVQADSLDPATRWRDWPGRVSLEVTSEGGMRDRSLAFDVRLTRLEGTLRGLPVSGTGEVAVDGPGWTVRQARAAWGGARLEAEGSGGDRYDLRGTLTTADLGPMLPGAAGSVRAELALTGTPLAPRFGLRAHADSIETPGLGAKDLALALDAGMREDDSLAVDLVALGVVFRDRLLDEVTLRGAGLTRKHEVTVGAHGGGDTLMLTIAGGLAAERWSGSVERFELHSRDSGTWRLQDAADLELSAADARLDSFTVRSGGGGLIGAADWRAGRDLHARAELSSLPMNVLAPLLPAGTSLTGRLDGSITARTEGPEGPLAARVRITQTPGLLIYDLSPGRRDTIPLGAGRLEFDSDAAGVRGAFTLAGEGGGRLEAQASLPGFNLMRPDTVNQPLEGRILFHTSDLAVVGAGVPGLDDTRGELNADVALSGTLARPEALGEVVLSGGRAAFPALGLQLEDASVTLRAAPGRSFALTGSVRSGAGSLSLEGSADFARANHPTAAFTLKGKDFTLASTREADVKASPDLEVRLDGARVDVGGQIDIPFARLVTVDRLANMPVPPSPDVVVVGREGDSLSAGPKVHSRVRVVIGDDVEVRVPHFRGKPEGSILVIDEPGQSTRASGELKVTDGTYRAYGQDLKIERGRLVFGGGDIANPGLDLRASRTASDGTIAGVQITGTAESPVLRIYSTPPMSENDALSYIMFGKSASETGSSGATSQAASQLGVSGADMLARGVAGKLGIQDASVESKEGSVQDASVFLGTYLSPKLYVSYGIGLMESSTTFRVRYKLDKRWSFQTESGASRSGLIQYTGER